VLGEMLYPASSNIIWNIRAALMIAALTLARLFDFPWPHFYLRWREFCCVRPSGSKPTVVGRSRSVTDSLTEAVVGCPPPAVRHKRMGDWLSAGSRS
jgi:hypothetical protein